VSGGEAAALVASAEAVALAMPLHHVEWPEDERPRFTCDAPSGSKCRLSCAEDCGAEEWPCSGWDDDKDAPTPDHPMTDSGECHVVLYLEDDDGWWEQDRYSGPIKVTWDGDHYDWEPVPTVTQGASDV
jgi:hypothetical protein